MYSALAAGASGFLLKDTGDDQLIGAIRAVAAGNGLFGPSITRRLIEHYATRADPAYRAAELKTLTERESEILELLAGARTNGSTIERRRLCSRTRPGWSDRGAGRIHAGRDAPVGLGHICLVSKVEATHVSGAYQRLRFLQQRLDPELSG